jgi:SAM-dependent methyltransferase
MTRAADPYLPAQSDLEALFAQKYGEPSTTGWAPRRRRRYGYYLPADVYEAIVAKCVRDGSRWIDVGGGHNIFPDNPRLARALVSRCARVVAVDPDPQTHANPFAHARAQCLIEDYVANETFDLATLRMVAEHVEYPDKVAAALARLVHSDGLVFVLTVNLWSPLTVLSRFTPFALHYPLKRLFWGGDEADTFPVQYKMNTHRSLSVVFERHGFEEAAFARLDDLSTFGGFRALNLVELTAWRGCRALGIAYPENCLLAIYRRR